MPNSTARILWTDVSHTAHTDQINDRLSSGTAERISATLLSGLSQLSRLISATTIVVLAVTSSR
jgi:hypothetical protein